MIFSLVTVTTANFIFIANFFLIARRSRRHTLGKSHSCLTVYEKKIISCARKVKISAHIEHMCESCHPTDRQTAPRECMLSCMSKAICRTRDVMPVRLEFCAGQRFASARSRPTTESAHIPAAERLNGPCDLDHAARPPPHRLGHAAAAIPCR